MSNDVRPFITLHYNPEKVDNIGLCLTQPYDVISHDQKEMYYNQHEYNVIRFILGKKFHSDTESGNQYTRARDYLKQWKELEILQTTTHPSYWVYEQEFELPGAERKKVKGFIAKVRLHDYDEMAILPHEKVMKNPIEDRMRLTKITNTQFEYIWGLYRDKSYTIDTILDKAEEKDAILDYYEMPYNVRHRLWRLTEPESCTQIFDAMKNHKIYIADGHHRYATMLSIRDEYRKKYPDAGPDAPWEFIMMFLVNTKHEGLTILPTHRLIHSLQISHWDNILKNIETYFDMAVYSFNEKNEDEVKKKWLSDIRTNNKGEHTFGLFLKNQKQFLLLTLKDINAYEALIKPDCSPEWKYLDVNIVNFLLLQKIFGISEEQFLLNTNIKYTIDAHAAVSEVKRGNMQAVVILNATHLDDVIRISDNREIMPRKSTFFYPKPVSGLVMYSMDMDTLK
jgi:uncharacterized protein (DUF1015 family)